MQKRYSMKAATPNKVHKVIDMNHLFHCSTFSIL